MHKAKRLVIRKSKGKTYGGFFSPNDTEYDRGEQFEPTVIYLPIFPCLPCVQMPRIPAC